ncbi:hypothetical protein CCACVL1_25367 [Corchorus capsularis]|uniref:SAM domain-containing protein n=1 Tax=Corchorus capsularis TaxID=210143 RepID=A0A1R3GL04_COCAP|nr:hypothetical protein CCACVL1_25367 [Corchorus capsularis]
MGFSEGKSPDCLISDPGLSPRITADLQQNRENKNPNSSKSGFDMDISDHETAATSKDACEYDVDEPGYASSQPGNADGYWKDSCYEGNNEFLKSGDGWNQIRYASDDVTSVRGWLEDLGFSRYAGIFEMHEVDEEALPLLTLDDLKEMGVFAVGHRRRLYTAIQQLRGDVSS